VADYAPVFLPGLVMTSVAVGAIVGSDILEVAGSGTVQKAVGTPSQKAIGIAAHDAASGAKVSVVIDRVVHEGLNEGGVTAGDQLVNSAVANRQVKTLPPLGGAPGQADVNAARAIIGVALTTAIDGATVRWMQK